MASPSCDRSSTRQLGARRGFPSARAATGRGGRVLAGALVACLAVLGTSPATRGADESGAPTASSGAGSEPGHAPHPDVPKLPDSAASQPAPEPQGYRMEDFRSPVPATLKGARVLTNDEAADLWNKNGGTFIDVYPQAPKPPNLPAGTFWRDPAHRSIEGAHWLPNVGYGALSPEMETYFRGGLEALSKGKQDAPLVFFCLKDCWMSWNAAKRALEYGYSNVMWFRDGTDGWQELGYPLVEVKKRP
ncbi:MAG: PQQ-dependent catabolism-associated CXXCW motif protein [Hyphomicrobium sp.]|jgi:PQQ-dependent catabolism-associated CXXCW motif protein